jgi:hypothetical protein
MNSQTEIQVIELPVSARSALQETRVINQINQLIMDPEDSMVFASLLTEVAYLRAVKSAVSAHMGQMTNSPSAEV